MEVLELHPVTPQERYIQKAVEVLKEGGIVIYPTDTVYGIGCDIFNKQALERIFTIKGDAGKKLMSFVCGDLKDIARYAKVSDYAYKTMRKLLPGQYTFILPAAREVPKKLWTKRNTVGIRVPDHPIAIRLAKELGNPIVSTSVTSRLGDVVNDPKEIQAMFGHNVDLMLDAGFIGPELSSIIDLSDDEPVVVREGAGDVSVFA